MARRRKTKHTKDLRKIDDQSPEYWAEILRREGLSMESGRNAHLVYVGGSEVMTLIEEENAAHGRVAPKDRAP